MAIPGFSNRKAAPQRVFPTRKKVEVKASGDQVFHKQSSPFGLLYKKIVPILRPHNRSLYGMAGITFLAIPILLFG